MRGMIELRNAGCQCFRERFGFVVIAVPLTLNPSPQGEGATTSVDETYRNLTTKHVTGEKSGKRVRDGLGFVAFRRVPPHSAAFRRILVGGREYKYGMSSAEREIQNPRKKQLTGDINYAKK